MANRNGIVMKNKNLRGRRPSYQTAILLLAALVLAGCGSDSAETEAASESQQAGSGGGEGDAQEPEGEAAALDVVIDPLRERYCNWDELEVKVIVFDFDKALAAAQVELNNRVLESRVGEDAEEKEFIIEMEWTIQLDGSGEQPAITGPQPDHTQRFQLGALTGEVTIIAEVKMVIQEVGGPQRFTVASGTDETTIQVDKCPVNVRLDYEGEFSDGVWTYTETASMADVRLDAPPDGPYLGTGQLSVVVSQTGNPGGGECASQEPFEGTSAVELTGDFDEDGEMFTLDLGFQPGQGGGSSMTCGAAGFEATVPVEGGPFDPGVWGLASLDFPPQGGTRDVSVGQGLRGAAGAGALTVVVEPVDEETAT